MKLMKNKRYLQQKWSWKVLVSEATTYFTSRLSTSYVPFTYKGPYFVKDHSDSKHKYTENDIVNMLEFLVDNIFVVFGGKVFQQIVGIPMGTKEHGSLPHHIARTLTARRICLGHSKSSILIQVHSIGYILSHRVNFVI